MRIVCTLMVIGLLVSTESFPQPGCGSTLFSPLVAAIYEPRFGALYQNQLRRMRLDIGYSADVFGDSVGQQFLWAVGLDGFTYTRLRTESNLRFPVETIDYMFGFNGSLRSCSEESMWMIRFRASHISAHLADGLADSSGTLSPRPFVYSREFLDAIVAFKSPRFGIRAYGGGTMLFAIKPLEKSVGRFIPQLGVEWEHNIVIPLYLGVDVRVIEINDVIVPSIALQLSAIITEYRSWKIALCAYNYHGYSVHGMFYDKHEQYFALGVQVYY